MTAEPPGQPGTEPLLDQHLRRILDKTRTLADHALDRLRELSDQLPRGTVEQVERLHQDPVHERRKTVRVSDPSIPVAVEAVDLPRPAGTAIKDHCPSGFAILLPCPAGVGTLLRVRMPPPLGEGAWVTVEVKHCHKEGDGWIAGCEVVGERGVL